MYNIKTLCYDEVSNVDILILIISLLHILYVPIIVAEDIQNIMALF